MINRIDDLVLRAAMYLEGGGDPFSDNFLSENKVTLSEAMTMAEYIAKAIYYYHKNKS
jgi:hypothetical protein